MRTKSTTLEAVSKIPVAAPRRTGQWSQKRGSRVLLRPLLTTLLLTVVGVAAQARESSTVAELLEDAGIDVEAVSVESTMIHSGLYVLTGLGGNVLVAIGDQGTLIVDDQYPATASRIEARIRELGGDRVDFIVNTHWHFDHTGANTLLGEGGSWIVSHSMSRQAMTNDQLVDTVDSLVSQPRLPTAGLPVMTYDDRMQIHFNGEQIDLLHFGSAHTTGDTVVVFRGGNAVHMGDVYFNGRYPFIDSSNGGSLEGMIRFCSAVLQEISRDTIVVPGHGSVATYADLVDYVDMLSTIQGRVAALIASGATLEEVVAAEPTAEWDGENGDPYRFLNRVYAGSTR